MKSEKIEESYAASSKEEEVVKVSEKKVIEIAHHGSAAEVLVSIPVSGDQCGDPVPGSSSDGSRAVLVKIHLKRKCW